MCVDDAAPTDAADPAGSGHANGTAEPRPPRWPSPWEQICRTYEERRRRSAAAHAHAAEADARLKTPPAPAAPDAPAAPVAPPPRTARRPRQHGPADRPGRVLRWLPAGLVRLYDRLIHPTPYARTTRVRPAPEPDPEISVSMRERMFRVEIIQDAFCERRPKPQRLFRKPSGHRDMESWCDLEVSRYPTTRHRCAHCAETRALFKRANDGEWQAEVRLHRLATRASMRLLAERRAWADTRRRQRAARTPRPGPPPVIWVMLGWKRWRDRRKEYHPATDRWFIVERRAAEDKLVRAHTRKLQRDLQKRCVRMRDALAHSSPNPVSTSPAPLGPEHVAKIDRAAAGTERPGLGLVRRPGGHHRQTQRDLDPAPQPRERGSEQPAGRDAPVAPDQRVGLPVGPQVAQQPERVGVAERDVLAVDDRQREAGPLQQPGTVPQLGERRDAGRHAAGDLGLGLGQRVPQRLQRAEHGNAGEQQPVRPQRLPQLDQAAGQVVDPMQRHRRHRQVETPRREGQPFLIGNDRGAPAGDPCHDGADVDRNDLDAARAQQGGDGAASAQIQGAGEPPLGHHVVQPFDQPLGTLAQQVGDPGQQGGGPVAVQPHGTAVEDLHRHRPQMRRPIRLANGARVANAAGASLGSGPAPNQEGRMDASDTRAARAAAVAATIDRIRGIERDHGVTRGALAAIETEMLALAANEALFPAAEFPPPPAGEKASRRYLLQEDPDHRFALYLNALNPGNESKPHDHTTWAVVVAVEGQELNRVYRNEGNKLSVAREVMVEPGHGIGLMPDDIHSIHTLGDVPTRHLHMYGLALEKLDNRKAYDQATGEGIPYNANFMKPTVPAA